MALSILSSSPRTLCRRALVMWRDSAAHKKDWAMQLLKILSLCSSFVGAHSTRRSFWNFPQALLILCVSSLQVFSCRWSVLPSILIPC